MPKAVIEEFLEDLNRIIEETMGRYNFEGNTRIKFSVNKELENNVEIGILNVRVKVSH